MFNFIATKSSATGMLTDESTFPSTKDLKTLADLLLIQLSELNNAPDLIDDRKGRDTVAVGMSATDIIVTGNLKA